jgi:hypothetical protein
MPDNQSWIPLFPLNTVLFPGGVLPLKVFETRYMDMLRECMKHQRQQFGVVLIKSEQEVGAAAEPEDFGCLTQIVEWDMQDLGGNDATHGWQPALSHTATAGIGRSAAGSTDRTDHSRSARQAGPDTPGLCRAAEAGD